MIPTTVVAEKAVGSLFTVGVLVGPVPAGGRLVPPHAVRNRARRQHVHNRRFIAVVLSAICEYLARHLPTFYSLMRYSFQRLVTMSTISGAMTISGGHRRGWPSSGILAVASKPIFQPYFSKGEEWSSASTGPSASKVSRLGSTLLPTRKRTSCRFWTSTSSSTTMMNLESIISIMPQMALITFFAWPG